MGAGANDRGNLGDGTAIKRVDPVEIQKDVAEISNETMWMMQSIKKDGSIWYWKGTTSTAAQITPMQIAENIKAFNGITFISNDGKIMTLTDKGKVETLKYYQGFAEKEIFTEKVKLPKGN